MDQKRWYKQIYFYKFFDDTLLMVHKWSCDTVNLGLKIKTLDESYPCLDNIQNKLIQQEMKVFNDLD